MNEPLLQTRELAVHFPTSFGLAERLRGGERRVLKALDGINLAVPQGAVLGLVGESGSGKTTFGRVLVGLEAPTAGEVMFREAVVASGGKKMRPMPRDIQMVFQDPYSSLNPRMTIGGALAEAMRVHRIAPRQEIGDAVRQLLSEVGLGDSMAARLPGALSGGQRQRVSLARALAVQPSLLVLDEPVSALDVSIQAQIIKLLNDLRERHGLTMIFIAHELGVVRAISTHVAVMYLGKIMETGPVDEVFGAASHPYTQGLLAAAPRLGAGVRKRVPVVGGDIPSPLNIPFGCRFHPRCPKASSICRSEAPPFVSMSESHVSACHFAEATPLVRAAGGRVR